MGAELYVSSVNTSGREVAYLILGRPHPAMVMIRPEDSPDCPFQLIHESSGYSIVNARSVEAAARAAQMLMATAIDWTRPAMELRADWRVRAAVDAVQAKIEGVLL